MQVELNENEANAVLKVIDAALRGGGVGILAEAGWLKDKIVSAYAAEQKTKEQPTKDVLHVN